MNHRRDSRPLSMQSWQLAAVLVGLYLGYAVLLYSRAETTTSLFLLVLPVALCVAAFVKNIEMWLFSIAILDISLGIDISYFLQETFKTTRSGYILSLNAIAVIGLYLVILLQSAWRRKPISQPQLRSRLSLWIVLYFAAMILSLINSTSMTLSLFELTFQFHLLLFYFVILYYLTTEKKIAQTLNILTVGLFFQVVIVFIQYVTQSEFNLTSGEIYSINTFDYQGNTTFSRVGGTYTNPLNLASYLTNVMFILMGYFLATNTPRTRALIGVSLALGVVALLLSHTRAAWGAFVIGLGIFLLVSARYRWLSLKGVWITLFSGILLALPFLPRLILRLTSDDNGSTDARLYLPKLAWQMIQDHPLVGVGINNFGVVTQLYVTSELRGKWLHLVHNKYLLVFSEVGLFGLICFLFILLEMVYLSWRVVKANHPFLSPIALGILAGHICHMLTMLVDISSYRSSLELLWTMAALSVVSSGLLAHQPSAPSSPVAVMKKPLTV